MDPARDGEYASGVSAMRNAGSSTGHADAAIDRLGRPNDLAAIYDYIRGASLVDLHREAEAEVALRESVTIAESDVDASYMLGTARQGLGYLFENQGRYREAVAEYRRALAQVPDSDASDSAIVFRERLAFDLALLGDAAAAEPIARQAVALSLRAVGEANTNTPIARGVLPRCSTTAVATIKRSR